MPKSINLDVTFIETLNGLAVANPIGFLFASTALLGAVLWVWK